MKYIKIITLCLFIIPCNFIGSLRAQNISDYLIIQDIGDYKFITQSKDFITGQPKTIPGYSKRNSSGILAGTDHFSIDHNDITFETYYSNRNIKLGVKAQVTQHSGSDSDRWLLHEIERGFRDSDNLEVGPAEDTMIRELNANKIFFYGGGIVGYRWISNNIVINIQYTNLGGAKPEPLEVVQGYLTKFPSNIALTDNDLKAKPHNEQWIKDEMERRLWLCDKWFVQLESDRSKLPSILKTIADHMVVFLDYREKYYGIQGKDDKLALMGYLSAKNETSIRNKLTEYKNWWNVNKTNPINLP